MYAVLLNNLLVWSIIVASVGAAVLVGYTIDHLRVALTVRRAQSRVRSTPND